jgi:hypothetical protein
VPAGRAAAQPLRASRSSRCTRRATGRARPMPTAWACRASTPTPAASTPRMYRGRSWSQRQLIGLGVPEDYNARVKELLALGALGAVADPLQLGLPRLRRRRGAGRAAGHLRHGGQPRRRHGARARRRAHRRPVHRAERPLAVHAAGLRAGGGPKRRGVPWTRITGTSQPERLHLALRRQPHVLPHRAAGRAAHRGRPHRLRQRAGAGLEPAVHRRPAHAAGRRHAGRGDGLHAVLGDPVRRGLHRARHGPRPDSCRASPSSSTSRSACSRKSPSSAPGAASGPSCAASASAPRTRARGASSSTARPRAWT